METPTQFTQDADKVIEAVIYMAEQSKADSYFGERKVYKLLYYADCEAYRQHGSPITGTRYVHYPHGPFPENWPTLKKKMLAAGDVQIFGSHPPGRSQGSWTQPDLSATVGQGGRPYPGRLRDSGGAGKTIRRVQLRGMRNTCRRKQDGLRRMTATPFHMRRPEFQPRR